MLGTDISRDPTSAQRLLREAQAASTVKHPNIVEIFDVGEESDGTHYIVMEYLCGETLTDFIEREGQVRPGRAISLVIQIVSGLGAAHLRGVVHRDLKPDNLFLITTPEGREQVKILDFGISKVLDSSQHATLTHTGTVMGTPVYMSPEQARGSKDVDERTDIWSAGVIMYQLLSGRRPYDGDSYNEVLSKILVEPVPRLEDDAPHVPPEVIAVVDCALEKDRDVRYPDCISFCADLLALAEVVDSVEVGWEARELLSADRGGARPELGRKRVDSERQKPVRTPRTPPFLGPGTVMTADTVGATSLHGESAVPMPSHPTTDWSERSTASGGWAAAFETTAKIPAPKWKTALWYALTLPLAWALMAFPPGHLESGAATIFGFGEDAPGWLSYVIFGLCCGGLTVVSIFTHRFWATGRASVWLHGPGFLVFPVMGVLAALRCHSVTGGKVDTALASYRSYLAIGSNQANQITGVVWNASVQFLNTSFLDMAILAAAALIVLLGYMFAPPAERSGGDPPGWRRWVILPAGLLMFAVVDTIVLPDVVGWLNPLWRLSVYAVWPLVAIPVIRGARHEVVDFALGWRAVFMGAVSVIALSVVGAVGGMRGMYDVILQMTPDTRASWGERSGMSIGIAMHVVSTMVGTSLLLLVLLHRKSMGPMRKRHSKSAVGRIALGVFAVLLTGLPWFSLVSGSVAAGKAIDMSTGKPAIIEMAPGTLEPEGEPAFYIDRKPSGLNKTLPDFYARLAGESWEEFTQAELLELLHGYGECADVLEAATRVSEGQQVFGRVPARCVTAIEARLYCESRGKRLPSPTEWEAALGEVIPGGLTVDGKISRGEFAEWTMKLVHGTPTFYVLGATPAMKIPDTPSPEHFSRQIGFRCAFTF